MSSSPTQIIREIAAGIIALLVMISIILIVVYDTVNGRAISVPVELGLPATLIIGFFFGQHAATNGAVAATTAAIDHVEQSIRDNNAANNKSVTT